MGFTASFLIGGMEWLIASDAAPEMPFHADPLSIFCVTVMLASCVLALLSKVNRWDWQARYFGLVVFYMGTFSLLGVIPFLCIVLYGNLSEFKRLLLFVSYSTTVVWWCRRFVLFYRMIMAGKWEIYIEDEGAVYYLQKNDKWLLDKKYKFAQIPSMVLFLIMLCLALLSFPFSRTVSSSVGLPVMYVFMATGLFPFVLMVLGSMTRGFLIYYYYPGKIRKSTGKDVYVDLVTKTLP